MSRGAALLSLGQFEAGFTWSSVPGLLGECERQHEHQQRGGEVKVPTRGALDKLADALILYGDDKQVRRDVNGGILVVVLFGAAALRWFGRSQVEEGAGFVAAFATIAIVFVAAMFVFGWAVRKGWDRAGRKD